MSRPTNFEQAFGFPREDVTLANWRTGPFNRWAYHNVSEIVPSVTIPAQSIEKETAPISLGKILDHNFTLNGEEKTVLEILEDTYTDGLAVMKSGQFVGDWWAKHSGFNSPHLIFSISKSLTALVAGILTDKGLLDPSRPVTDFVPEAKDSAYGDATVQHVLDMTVSLDFSEAYMSKGSLFSRYREAMLWNPGGSGETLREFLCSLGRLAHPHGEIFSYCSPNSDMLGLIIERASGERLHKLMEELVLAPLGSRHQFSITVDGVGQARTAGGMSVAPRDLARIGEMMRMNGVAADGTRIVSEDWVKDTTTGGDLEAWAKGDFAELFPGGSYRNKWYQSAKGYYCGIGIHGQWLVVHPEKEIVIAKSSSQPEPAVDEMDETNLRLLEELCKLF